MSSSSGSVSKATAERHQRILLELLKQPGNDVCADCRTRNPRWASWNLGIFICVKCAGIHRKLGTHITKVKSLTLDSWTKEQVQCMKQFGNIKSNQIFNPNDAKNPPPTDFEESERDSQLEKYIRMKYESKRFMNHSRRNESVGSCSASVSSGVSFTMSNSPTHSPASSIYQQSPSKSLSLPFRSPSAAATPMGDNPSSHTDARIPASGAKLPMTSSKAPLDSSQPQAQFNTANRGIPMTHHEFQPPVPPLRASTAPIPSDAPPNFQSMPPLPTMSSRSQNLGCNVFQTTQPRKQESLPPLLHTIQPSLDIHTYTNQSIQKMHNPPAPAPRRDGVWGDLMQLTEPTHSNTYGTLSGSNGIAAPAAWNSNSLNATNPSQQSFSASTFSAKMNNLEIGMGKLMNEPSSTLVNSVSSGAGFISQPVGPNNPFTNQMRPFHPTSGTFQPFPSVQAGVNAMGEASGTFQPTNPFTNPLFSSTNLGAAKSSDLSSTSFSRNPFLNPNTINQNNPYTPSTVDQFGNHLTNPHQNSQPSHWSINHHPTPFF